MCDLCQDPASGKANLVRRAEQLERLALDLRAIASGRLSPHSDGSKPIAGRALAVVRYLAAEWL